MTIKVFAGAFLSFVYNAFLTYVPASWLRNLFLRCYLDRLGNRTHFQMGCRFLNGRRVSFGNKNVINFGCLFDGRKYNITTGDHVSIGPEASILTLGHDPQSPDFADQGGDVTIGNRVWIGYRVLILPGVTIGDGAVVGAGSVVTRDVAPFTIVAGNPAKPIGQRNKALHYELNFQPFLT